MLVHEEFRELSALAAIGQVTSTEYEELSVHMKKCPDCREAYAEYARILRQELPQADSTRFRKNKNSVHPATDLELRERFLARTRAYGAHFSSEVDRPAGGAHATKSIPWMQFAFATAAVLVIGAGLTLWMTIYQRRVPVSGNLAALISEKQALRNELNKTTDQLAALSGQVSELSTKEAQLAGALKEKDVRLADARRTIDRLGAQLGSMVEQNSTLVASREHYQSMAAALKSRIQVLEVTNANSVAAMAELQEQIRAVKLALGQESQKVLMQQQLSSVSSDVRQLMGARNLHIIDVHDVNGAGKSAKSFGRVFYAEGQSLVFYAFDFPSGKLAPAKYHFNAWGQQEGQAQSVRNLGTFSIDDREQRRWVLKVSDASLLKGMDSVFVTAETVGDANQPRGKRVLYAYLSGRPNHP
jgi:hypothetical protein